MLRYSRRERSSEISSEDAFVVWAPDGVLWSEWAKPVAFVQMDSTISAAAIPDSRLPSLPLGLDSGSALIVDLPGVDAVLAGLVLADQGFRPVPLFNGTSGPSAVIPVSEISEALGAGADRLRTRTLAPGAAPAFLLDSRRQTGTPRPGAYDNRWVVLPQDFPSGLLLRNKGIRHATLIQRDGLDVAEDLAHVLRRWQEQGIQIHAIDVSSGRRADITVRRPSWFRLAWYVAATVFRFRRSNVGGFGSVVPQQTSGGYG